MAIKTLLNGFGIKESTKKEVNSLIKKAKKEVGISSEVCSSKKLSLRDRIVIISKEVNKVLGKYKSFTKVITDLDELKSYIMKSNEIGYIAIDTETNNSKDPMSCKIMGLCLYTEGLDQIYVPVNHVNIDTEERLPEQLTEEQLKEALESVSAKIIMHNAAFDIEVCDRTCFNSENSLECFWDTMLAAKILDENNSAKLKDLYQRFIDEEEDTYSIETFFKGIPYKYVPPDIFALYAATDSYKTYKLFRKQVEMFRELNDEKLFNVFMKIEMGVLPCVVSMEETGIGLDYDYVNNLHKTYHKQLDIAQKELDNILLKYEPEIQQYRQEHPKAKLDTPISIASPTQLAILLYDILKLKSPNPEKPRATGEEELKGLNHALSKPILDFRKFSKMITTYIDKLPNDANPRTKKIHARFNQIGRVDKTVVTGRFSSSDPNLQNIPSDDKKLRPMFIADKGNSFNGGDYSQQEPRTLAHFSGDKNLIQTYIDGKDLYATVGARVLNLDYWDCMEHRQDGSRNEEGATRRSMMKSIVLGIIYGQGAASVAQKTGQTKEEAAKTIEDFYKAFPTVKQWMDDSIEMAHRLGYVTTICGRRRRLPNINLPKYEIIDTRNLQYVENNVLFEDIVIDIDNTEEINYYKEKLEHTYSKYKINEIIKEAQENGFRIVDNTGKIAGAVRQCVNARIQGSAADLSKLAMIKIYNDKRLQELGFKLVYVIHDEIAGQGPLSHSDLITKYLKEDMIEAAKDVCSVPMKVDTYTTTHWYLEELSGKVKKAYLGHINKGNTEEESFELINQEFIEIDKEVLKKMCNGTIEFTTQTFARKEI